MMTLLRTMMRRFERNGLVLAALLWGCSGGETGPGPSDGGLDNAGLRERLDGCGMAINVQNAEVGNLSACLVGTYVGTLLFTETRCSAALAEDGEVRFTVGEQTRGFRRPFLYEGYTKKPRPLSASSTTGYSIDWRADGAEEQSLVLDFNNDLRDGLQLRYSVGSSIQTCFLTVP